MTAKKSSAVVRPITSIGQRIAMVTNVPERVMARLPPVIQTCLRRGFAHLYVVAGAGSTQWPIPRCGTEFVIAEVRLSIASEEEHALTAVAALVGCNGEAAWFATKAQREATILVLAEAATAEIMRPMSYLPAPIVPGPNDEYIAPDL